MARGGLHAQVSQFEALIAADREILGQLWKEVDSLDVELKILGDSRRQLRQHVQSQRDACGASAQQQQQMEGQLHAARQQLNSIGDDRRAANLDVLSLRHDRDHFQEELSFLQQTAEEEMQALQIIQHVNDYLDKCNDELTLEIEALEGQRRELLQQVASERELNRTQERETAEMRSRLERMRREHSLLLEKRREAVARERRIQEMKCDAVRGSNPPERGLLKGHNTWAAALTRPRNPSSGASGIAVAPVPAAPPDTSRASSTLLPRF